MRGEWESESGVVKQDGGDEIDQYHIDTTMAFVCRLRLTPVSLWAGVFSGPSKVKETEDEGSGIAG